MAYTVRQLLLDKTSHNLKYKYGSSFTPTQITYHQTSNSAPAINERNYLNNRTDKNYVSFHWVVDESEAIQCLPENVTGWHSGDGSNGDGNKKSIGIEIARSTSPDIALRDKSIDNGAKLIATLMIKYNISMSNVKSHYQRSSKNCPHDIRGRYDETKFRNLIQSYYNQLKGNSQQTSTPSQPSTSTSFKVGDKIKVKTTATQYATGQSMSSFVKGGEYEITRIDGNKLLLSNIVSWVWDYDVELTTQTSVNPSTTTSYKVKITCDSLNVRQYDSFDSKVVATVKKGEVFTIVKESNGLGLLKSGLGYISLNSNYVAKV